MHHLWRPCRNSSMATAIATCTHGHCASNCRFSNMARWAHKVTEDNLPTNEDNLVPSLRPILYCLRVMGTDLEVGQPRSRFRHYCFILTTILLMVFVCSGNIIHALVKPVKGFPVSIHDWCKILRKVTRVVSGVSFQLAFVRLFLFQWKSLLKKAQKVEQSVRFPAKSRWNLRKALFVIFVAVVAVVRKRRKSSNPIRFNMGNCN